MSKVGLDHNVKVDVPWNAKGVMSRTEHVYPVPLTTTHCQCATKFAVITANKWVVDGCVTRPTASACLVARMVITILIVVSHVETVIAAIQTTVHASRVIPSGGEERARPSVAQHVRGMDKTKSVDRQTDIAYRVV